MASSSILTSCAAYMKEKPLAFAAVSSAARRAAEEQEFVYGGIYMQKKTRTMFAVDIVPTELQQWWILRTADTPVELTVSPSIGDLFGGPAMMARWENFVKTMMASGAVKKSRALLIGQYSLTAFLPLLRHVTEIELEECRSLRSISELAGYDHITSLVVDSPALTDISAVSTLPNLEKVTLCTAHITSLEPFVHCKKLNFFQIGGESLNTHITTLEPLRHLKKLRHLEIYQCSIVHMDALANFKELGVVKLYGCPELENVDGLAGLPRLTEVEILHCRRLVQVDGLRHLPSLKKVTVVDCPVEDLNMLSTSKELRTAEVGPCGTGVTLECFTGFSKLRGLRAALCRVPSLNVLAGCTGLTKLRLTSCEGLTTLDGLPELPLLTEFWLSFSEIDSLQPLERCPNLRVLHLDHCEKLTTLDNMPALPQLTIATITSCGIHSLDAFSRSSALQQLVCDDCPNVSSISGLKGIPALVNLTVGYRLLESCMGSIMIDGETGEYSRQPGVKLISCPKINPNECLLAQPGVKVVVLVNCSITNVGGLKRNTSLTQFHIEGCPQLTSLKGLRRHPTLRSVSVTGCPLIRDIDVLLTCPKLFNVKTHGKGAANLAPVLTVQDGLRKRRQNDKPKRASDVQKRVSDAGGSGKVLEEWKAYVKLLQSAGMMAFQARRSEGVGLGTAFFGAVWFLFVFFLIWS
ncbi:hypothetical protein ADEAN_000707400 [Angomonas deanei]|uniref:Uncharacterized protein n=1 Tax=Angomonas deanei TaxID=59799 RepID=A0A7G2CJK9_9TRYP|nr:hypothetical protein ADEAN_000707400 [Angomonas deanei]